MATTVKVQTNSGEIEVNIDHVASLFTALSELKGMESISDEVSELRNIHRENFPDDGSAKTLKRHDTILQILEYELPTIAKLTKRA